MPCTIKVLPVVRREASFHDFDAYGGAPLGRRGLLTQAACDQALRLAREAHGPEERGGVHILRHTFCSHLAMQGAPGKAIQELAGHQEMSVTQGYMHLSPDMLGSSIRLLGRNGGFDPTRDGP